MANVLQLIGGSVPKGLESPIKKRKVIRITDIVKKENSMTNEEAIKYLQQLYPDGGHCWLDEQRTEAIGMAIKALKEEPVSEDLEEASTEICSKILKGETVVIDGYEYVVLSDAEECFKVGAKWQKVKSKMDILEEPVSEDLEEAIKVASEKERMRKAESESPFFMPADFASGFKVGAKWKQERIEETLLSEVLPLFMHGGEADEVIAKLEEVLYYKEKED